MRLHITTYQSSLKANENFKHQRHLKHFVLGHNFRMFSSKVWPWTRRAEKTLNSRDSGSGPVGWQHGAPASQPGGSHWEEVNQKDRGSEDGRASRRKKRNGREKYSEESEKDRGNMSEGKTEKWEEIKQRCSISHCFIWRDFKQLERPLISVWLCWYHVVLSGVGELSPNGID